MKCFAFTSYDYKIGDLAYQFKYKYETLKGLIYSTIKDKDIDNFIGFDIIELETIDGTFAKVINIIPFKDWIEIYNKLVIIS